MKWLFIQPIDLEEDWSEHPEMKAEVIVASNAEGLNIMVYNIEFS